MTQRFIPITAVKIDEERVRKEFPEKENQELQASILKPAGLLQAPVFELVGEDYALRAGERRIIAIKDIYALGQTFNYSGSPVPPGMVPFTLLQDLSEIERLEVEIDENDRRLDPTWQERAMATARLKRLRELQAEQSNLPSPTVADISVEVRGSSAGIYQDTTRKEIILAKNMTDPDVAKAKSVDEAFKILKRKETAKKNEELAKTVGKTFSSSQHILLNTDSLSWMCAAPDSFYDIILTDPPYGMGADEFGDSGMEVGGSHFYTDDIDTARICYQTLAYEGFRITKPDAHLYAFCDIDLFPELKSLFTAAGWKVFRTPLIWYKPSAFRAPWPEHGPQRKYETILYAIKGDRKVNKLFPDVITCPPDTNLGHQAQKPVALYSDLLSRSARSGDQVLDPFCGTGPIIPAGHGFQCTVTAIELDPTAYGIAVSRLQSIDAQKEIELCL